MDKKQLEKLLTALVQSAMNGDQKATQQIQQIMLAAQQGDLKAAQIAQMIQAIAQNMKLMAKFGAKLNYIRTLKGKCPDGYETAYFEAGGLLKKTCKKCQQGSEFTNDVIADFKAKCGKKIKKCAKKCQQGAEFTNDAITNFKAKCGKKIKKGAEGMTSAKCGKKIKKCSEGMASAKCGKKIKKGAEGMASTKSTKRKSTRPKLIKDSGWMGTDDGYEREKQYSDGTVSRLIEESDYDYARGRDGKMYDTSTAWGANKVDSIRRVDGFGHSPIIRYPNFRRK